MQLALLTQSYPPMVSGAALVVQRLAQGLAGRGHQVLVLAASAQREAYVEEEGLLRVAHLQALPNPLRHGQRFLLWPQAALAREFARFQPQIIHMHDPLVMSLAGLRAPQTLTAKTPRVLTLHQLPWFVSLLAPSLFRRPIESGLWAYGRWLYRHFNAIIAPSRMIADLVENRTDQRPCVISNGLDLDRFKPEPASPTEATALRQRYGLEPHLPIILYTGRLDLDKRVDLVIRATAVVCKTLPVQLLLVGDGRERTHLEQLVGSLGLGQVARFTGFVPSSGDLPGLYRLASVFTTASQVEIQSSVVLEAAASGLPVVAVQASSMPEFVHEGITGYLAPSSTDEEQIVKSLAERLTQLLLNPVQARQMGQAGRVLASEHSQAQALAQHEQLYNKLLEE